MTKNNAPDIGALSEWLENKLAAYFEVD